MKSDENRVSICDPNQKVEVAECDNADEAGCGLSIVDPILVDFLSSSVLFTVKTVPRQTIGVIQLSPLTRLTFFNVFSEHLTNLFLTIHNSETTHHVRQGILTTDVMFVFATN
jgi:hypothetical protein